jgi:protein subunit release factor A
MNELLKKIKENLSRAMKLEIELRKQDLTSDSRFRNAIAQKTVSRAIISMIPELGKKPDETTVEDIYKLLKKYVGNEKERQLYVKKHITQSDVEGISPSDLKKLVNKEIQDLGNEIDTLEITIAESYLPKQPAEGDIKQYITENIDLSQFKNKMQAMGSIMKAFPGVDGNFVKNILLKI